MTNRNRLLLTVASLLLVGLSTVGSVLGGSQSIVLFRVFKDGQPVGGAKISLFDENYRQFYGAYYTGSDGTVSVELAYQKYLVIVEYDNVKKEFSLNHAQDEVFDVDLTEGWTFFKYKLPSFQIPQIDRNTIIIGVVIFAVIIVLVKIWG